MKKIIESCRFFAKFCETLSQSFLKCPIPNELFITSIQFITSFASLAGLPGRDAGGNRAVELSEQPLDLVVQQQGVLLHERGEPI